MELRTELVTPDGVIQCILRRIDWHGADVIKADMWRSERHLDSTYTAFSACVYLQWNEQAGRYAIILSSRAPKQNQFWCNLELLLSNTIIVNE